MEYFVLFTLGALLAVLGILGCFVPILPGPILAYASLWMFPIVLMALFFLVVLILLWLKF